jgi:hypothetical protein
MEAGVEDGDLWDRAEKTLDNRHAFQLGANVKRCKLGSAFNCCARFGGNEHWVFEVRAAVDNAVPHDIDL